MIENCQVLMTKPDPESSENTKKDKYKKQNKTTKNYQQTKNIPSHIIFKTAVKQKQRENVEKTRGGNNHHFSNRGTKAEVIFETRNTDYVTTLFKINSACNFSLFLKGVIITLMQTNKT